MVLKTEDLSKAFDCVDHALLLKKLGFYGIVGNNIKFIPSFLSNRYQKVFSKGEFSEPTFLEFRKAQGLVLRLFLFLVVINGFGLNVEMLTPM